MSRLTNIRYTLTELPNKTFELNWVYKTKINKSALQLAKEARRLLLES